jgi:hypothetical protein
MTDVTNPPERDSERAMRELREEYQPPERSTSPTGGPEHPFVNGEISVDIGWNGVWTMTFDPRTPINLSHHESNQIDLLLNRVRMIVYRAMWRAAHPEESHGAR